MERYRNLSGRSGVVAYEVSATAIVVRFADGGEYVYTYDEPGEPYLEAMKALARDGRGLATYINRLCATGLRNGRTDSRRLCVVGTPAVGVAERQR